MERTENAGEYGSFCRARETLLQETHLLNFLFREKERLSVLEIVSRLEHQATHLLVALRQILGEILQE